MKRIYSESVLPRIVTITECDFPIVEGDVLGYNTIHLPECIRRIFDTREADIVRMQSREVIDAIPDFGGKGSGEQYSLLPHQDHLDPEGDARRFLMLTKHEDGIRGASTLAMTPSVVARMLPVLEQWVLDTEKRTLIGAERTYDDRFLISPDEYDTCFDEVGGYERVVAGVLGENTLPLRELAVRVGLIGYLVRGLHADDAMREVAETFAGMFFEETWERAGVLIIDNPRLFHARLGGNIAPLQRNYAT